MADRAWQFLTSISSDRGDKAMIEKESVKSGRVRVTFDLPMALWAERVNLAGEFNNRQAEGR
jgi:hypothetical protein